MNKLYFGDNLHILRDPTVEYLTPGTELDTAGSAMDRRISMRDMRSFSGNIRFKTSGSWLATFHGAFIPLFSNGPPITGRNLWTIGTRY